MTSFLHSITFWFFAIYGLALPSIVAGTVGYLIDIGNYFLAAVLAPALVFAALAMTVAVDEIFGYFRGR